MDDQEKNTIDPSEAETVRAICRVMAQLYRQGGTDPKTITGEQAWTDYVTAAVTQHKLMGVWENANPYYKAWLQLDSPGGVAFRQEWGRMSREQLLDPQYLLSPPGPGFDLRRD